MIDKIGDKNIITKVSDAKSLKHVIQYGGILAGKKIKAVYFHRNLYLLTEITTMNGRRDKMENKYGWRKQWPKTIHPRVYKRYESLCIDLRYDFFGLVSVLAIFVPVPILTECHFSLFSDHRQRLGCHQAVPRDLISSVNTDISLNLFGSSPFSFFLSFFLPICLREMRVRWFKIQIPSAWGG